MEVLPVGSLDNILEEFSQNSRNAGLFLYEGQGEKKLKLALRDIRTSKDLRLIWIFVGSEGGFSEEEVDRFGVHCLSPITLGDQILRVETACISALAAISYELDLL